MAMQPGLAVWTADEFWLARHSVGWIGGGDRIDWDWIDWDWIGLGHGWCLTIHQKALQFLLLARLV